jgi:hypothetical protein
MLLRALVNTIRGSPNEDCCMPVLAFTKDGRRENLENLFIPFTHSDIHYGYQS